MSNPFHRKARTPVRSAEQIARIKEARRAAYSPDRWEHPVTANTGGTR